MDFTTIDLRENNDPKKGSVRLKSVTLPNRDIAIEFVSVDVQATGFDH
jgi:hypothetical protein